MSKLDTNKTIIDDNDNDNNDNNDNDNNDNDDNDDNEKINYILTERKVYIDLLLELLTVCKKTKQRLDMYYNDLHLYHSIVQTSVIIVSTSSTFIQSLFTNSLENVVPIITLCISTYSSLILSLAKFFKLDERKEQVHNLRERYTELNNKIRYNIDLLKPWKEKSYYNNLEIKSVSWKSLIEQIESEYIIIIDTKKTLFMEFEKIIDSLMWKKYTIKYDKKELKYDEILKSKKKDYGKINLTEQLDSLFNKDDKKTDILNNDDSIHINPDNSIHINPDNYMCNINR
tara:strand:- start:2556 stop:3413 length:858 start_codon:yes stop_codon:yes gene_type:complete